MSKNSKNINNFENFRELLFPNVFRKLNTVENNF